MRVALVDDHHLVREALSHVLALQPGIVVVGEAADREGAFDLLANSSPDVMLVDITYQTTTAFRCFATLRTVGPVSVSWC